MRAGFTVRLRLNEGIYIVSVQKNRDHTGKPFQDTDQITDQHYVLEIQTPPNLEKPEKSEKKHYRLIHQNCEQYANLPNSTEEGIIFFVDFFCDESELENELLKYIEQRFSIDPTHRYRYKTLPRKASTENCSTENKALFASAYQTKNKRQELSDFVVMESLGEQNFDNLSGEDICGAFDTTFEQLQLLFGQQYSIFATSSVCFVFNNTLYTAHIGNNPAYFIQLSENPNDRVSISDPEQETDTDDSDERYSPTKPHTHLHIERLNKTDSRHLHCFGGIKHHHRSSKNLKRLPSISERPIHQSRQNTKLFILLVSNSMISTSKEESENDLSDKDLKGSNSPRHGERGRSSRTPSPASSRSASSFSRSQSRSRIVDNDIEHIKQLIANANDEINPEKLVLNKQNRQETDSNLSALCIELKPQEAAEVSKRRTSSDTVKRISKPPKPRNGFFGIFRGHGYPILAHNLSQHFFTLFLRNLKIALQQSPHKRSRTISPPKLLTSNSLPDYPNSSPYKPPISSHKIKFNPALPAPGIKAAQRKSSPPGSPTQERKRRPSLVTFSTPDDSTIVQIKTPEKTKTIQNNLANCIRSIIHSLNKIAVSNRKTQGWHKGLNETYDKNLLNNTEDDFQLGQNWSKIKEIFTYRVEGKFGLTRWTSQNSFLVLHKRAYEIDLVYRAIAQFEKLYTLSNSKISNLEDLITLQTHLDFVDFIDEEIARLQRDTVLTNIEPKVVAYRALKAKILDCLHDPKITLDKLIQSISNQFVIYDRSTRRNLFKPSTETDLANLKGGFIINNKPATFFEIIQWDRSGKKSSSPKSVKSYANFHQQLDKLKTIHQNTLALASEMISSQRKEAAIKH